MLSCGVALPKKVCSPCCFWMPPHHPQAVLSKRTITFISQTATSAHPRDHPSYKPRSESIADRALPRKNAMMLRSLLSPTAVGIHKRMPLPSAALLASLAFFARASSILQSLALRTGLNSLTLFISLPFLRRAQTPTDPNRRSHTLPLPRHHDCASATAAQRASKPIQPSLQARQLP